MASAWRPATTLATGSSANSSSTTPTGMQSPEGLAPEELDGFELALVLGQRHVEALGQPLARRGGRRRVLRPASGQPAAAQRAVGEDAHAVALGGGQDVELDAS